LGKNLLYAENIIIVIKRAKTRLFFLRLFDPIVLTREKRRLLMEKTNYIIFWGNNQNNLQSLFPSDIINLISDISERRV